MMGAVNSCERSVNNQTTQRNLQQIGHLHSGRPENLKSHTLHVPLRQIYF
jgi:hypothetical protein